VWATPLPHPVPVPGCHADAAPPAPASASELWAVGCCFVQQPATPLRRSAARSRPKAGDVAMCIGIGIGKM